MKKTIPTIVMAVLCLIFNATAQQLRYLKGRIITPNQQPLPGATIKHGKTIMLTDQNGQFEITSSNQEGTITISYTHP